MTAYQVLAVLALCAASNVAAQTSVGPAPAGPADKVAARVIREAEHPCPRVVRATRDASGAIRAACSNGEDYLIASMSNPKHGKVDVALRCSAARKLGISC